MEKTPKMMCLIEFISMYFFCFVKCQYLPLLQLQINLDSRLKMPILVNPESERASSVLG